MLSVASLRVRFTIDFPCRVFRGSPLALIWSSASVLVFLEAVQAIIFGGQPAAGRVGSSLHEGRRCSPLL